MPKYEINTKYKLGDAVKFRKYKAKVISIKITNDPSKETTYWVTYRNDVSGRDVTISDVPEKELNTKVVKKKKSAV